MTDQNIHNETPDSNPVTLIGIYSNGNEPLVSIMRSGDGPINSNTETGNQSEEVDEKKTPLPEKKEIQGTSDVSSAMDKDGNIEIKVKYDSNSYTCCVCYEGIVGPIVSCENAHSLCSDCIMGISKTGDERCPVCRSNSKGRNYLLEKALMGMIDVCPFANQGCNHRSYPDNMHEHTSICRFSEINCPWCKKKTTPFDLQAHTAFGCKKKFSEMSCSNRIDFIKSDKIKNVLLVSAMEESRILYVEKTEKDCNLLCIQGTNTDDPVNSIVITYVISVKSLDSMTLTETRKIRLPIHKPEHLIKGQVLIHTIPLAELSNHENITITGFREKYTTGGRWMVQDFRGHWYRATIQRRVYNPDRILVKFDTYPSDNFDEWIEIRDNNSSRIRSLDANNGRTTREELQYVENLDEEEQLRLVMERSMDDM